MSCISAFAQNGRDLYVVFTDILLLVMRKHGGVTAAFVFGRTVICRDMDVATRVARNDGLDVAKSKGDRVVVKVKRDEWFRAAMADETVVVELLLRLKHQSSPPHTTPMFLRWGVRQQRSRSSPINIKREKGTVGSGEFSNTTTRFSPTTPLSWSGGAGSGSSPLAAADGGLEESSRPSSPPLAYRSKVWVKSSFSDFADQQLINLTDENDLLLSLLLSVTVSVSVTVTVR
ncbi:hypothetical protein ACFE04_018140 [Oxalis oulophora]